MRAVILAAGRGTRIRPAHSESPKCLISFGGKSILDFQIEGLFSAGIEEIGVVVGYEGWQIVRHICRTYPHRARRFAFFWNHDFASTNNIFSLWLTRDWLRAKSFLCLNADLLCDAGILAAGTLASSPISMIVDPDWREETMKVIIHGDRITHMSKKIGRDQFSATYIGATLFSREIQPAFFSKLDQWIRAGQRDVFFNSAVQELANEGVHVGFTKTRGLPWAEIDDPTDLEFARTHVISRLQHDVAA